MRKFFTKRMAEEKIEDEEKNLRDRIEGLHMKIYKKYPELTSTSTGIHAGGLSFPEQVKAYYELETMEYNKRQNKIMMMLTIMNILVIAYLGYLTYLKP